MKLTVNAESQPDAPSNAPEKKANLTTECNATASAQATAHQKSQAKAERPNKLESESETVGES